MAGIRTSSGNVWEAVRIALFTVGVGATVGLTLTIIFALTAMWGWRPAEVSGVISRLLTTMGFWFTATFPVTFLLTVMLLALIERAERSGLRSVAFQTGVAGIIGALSGIAVMLPFTDRWENYLPGILFGVSICAVSPFIRTRYRRNQSSQHVR